MAAVSSELIAVTLVIESSMVVYDDFYQRPLPHNSNPTGPPLVRYLSEIFKRLTAVHRKAQVCRLLPLSRCDTARLQLALQFRIAYVTYGPPDHYPSPLVRKQYFAYYRHVTETLGKEPEGGRVMGIGSTSAVESIGMAALDGLVAAVEVRCAALRVKELHHPADPCERCSMTSPSRSGTRSRSGFSILCMSPRRPRMILYTRCITTIRSSTM